MRYNQLIPLIQKHKPKYLIEVGTWNGLRAIMMAQEAIKHQPQVTYIGYDLFENITPEIDARELNVKAHASIKEVSDRLNEFADKTPGFFFQLHQGDTRETLHGKSPLILKEALVFIDGGHSLETIAGDYAALKDAKVVVLDDYYVLDEQNRRPDIEKYGCNKLIDTMDNALILPGNDLVKDGGYVHMVCIPANAWPGKINLVIKTRNCVAPERIMANIKYASTLIKEWVVQCSQHDKTAVIVSGGPNYKKHLKEIKELSEKPDHYLFYVKTSHDFLIKKGLIPWGTFLLDPRPHVLDFIENPHKDVRYFCATMCHPVTVDKVIESGAKVYGYNAVVGAGEVEVIKAEKKTDILIPGGSTAAIRGISLLHALGFRKFIMFGFDSCYNGKPKDVHGFNKRKQPFEVEMAGRKFWTDAELLAQAQDFNKLMETANNVQIDIRGDGMIPYIWSLRKRLPEFTDYFK